MDNNSVKQITLLYFSDRYIFNHEFRNCIYDSNTNFFDMQCGNFVEKARIHIEGWGINFDNHIGNMIYSYISISNKLPKKCVNPSDAEKQLCFELYKALRSEIQRGISDDNR